jgi:hypothetical protein
LGHSKWTTTKLVAPQVNPRIFKVAIKGAPTFPKKGKTQESPWEGIHWLVSSRNFSITSDLKKKIYKAFYGVEKLQSTHSYKILSKM